VTLISSRLTVYYKRVFPIFWFGFLALFMVGPLFFESWSGQSLQPMFFIVPAVMMVFGYFIMKKMVFSLVDQVFDAGDALLVKNGAQQERILLSDITNVSYTPMMNPPQVTLSLRQPTSFGDKVTFCAPTRLIPFASSPAIDELIKRVDAARRRAR
jgi:hypothetical protein